MHKILLKLSSLTINSCGSNLIIPQNFIHQTSVHFKNRLNKVVYPWMNKQEPYWQKQKAIEGTDDSLSDENKQFFDDNHAEMIKSLIAKKSPLKEPPWPKSEFIPNVTQRTGVIGIKLGTYPMFTKKGKRRRCTLIQVLDNHALHYVPPNEISRYPSLYRYRPYMPFKDDLPAFITQKRWGLQFVGAMSADSREFHPDWIGLFKKAGVPVKRKITRFFVSPDAALQPGTPIPAEHFRIGDFVDITGRTINHGFEGVIQRWGMKGGPAALGSTKFHRKMGSAAGGGRRILRGKRMPGVKGNRYRTVRGLQVVRMIHRCGVIYVNGCIPGPVNSYCYIHDTWLTNRKLERFKNPPNVPTTYPEDLPSDMPQDEMLESLQGYDDPSVMYEQNK